MNMVTRCPGCNTLFRVTTEQLQARDGKVRCGRCTLVFDGFKMLSAMPEQAVTELPDHARASVADANSLHSHPDAGDAPIATSGIATDDQLSNESNKDADLTPQAAGGITPKGAPAGAGNVVAAAAPAPLSRDWDEDFQEQPAPAMSQRGRWLWATASFLLMFAIAAQAAYFYRTQLASNFPGLSPALAKICSTLGCSVPLPQGHDLIKVEASDLQFVDPARPAVIQLRVTLRNPAPFDVAYPALDLVLTNTQDHTLARRIFLPGEYLGAGKDANSGIPAKAEVSLSLDLDTGDLGASGFRLYLLPGLAG